MATDTAAALARLEAGQAEMRTGQEGIAKVLEGQGEVLRSINERLGLILEKLYPEAPEGPTLHELLAELVARLGDQTVLLSRIDRRTESMASNLPADIVRAMEGAGSANGNGEVSGPVPS